MEPRRAIRVATGDLLMKRKAALVSVFTACLVLAGVVSPYNE